MKKISFLFVFTTFLLFPQCFASQAFNAPVPSGGKTVSSGSSATVNILYTEVSLKEITDFYKNTLTNETDIKWHTAKHRDKSIIYDWGNRDWHKIDIVDRGKDKGILVTIKKDSWTWIIGTLVIRFVGVFIVLIVLMVTLYVSGYIFSSGNVKTGNEKS